MPSSYSSENRGKVLTGFPIKEPFENINDVREYLTGESVICLLCGKSYRRLGMHLKMIHNMTVDEYKAKYKIPWTYGLSCSESKKIISDITKRRIKEGSFHPPYDPLSLRTKSASQRRKCPFKEEIGLQNMDTYLNKPKLPLTPAPDGSYETVTQRRERLRTKRGTQEHHEKMKNRPQCQPEVMSKTAKEYWTGRKQSPEHIKKRITNGIKTKQRKENKWTSKK